MKVGMEKMNPVLYIESRKHKNSKLWFNLKNLAEYCIPNYFYRRSLASKLALLENYDSEDIMARVNYYNKLTTFYSCGASSNYFSELKCNTSAFCSEGFIKIKDFTLAKGYTPHTHFFDTYQYVRYFNSDERFSFLFGDITKTPSIPQIVKSRPINGDNANSIVLNLNKVRHFMFINDKINFEDKKNMLVGRGAIYQKHRVRFYEKYFNHPLCDLGHVGGKISHLEWNKGLLPISKHLEYKFILCLEGNDVASNLKWVMSSNSIAVMPKPKYETWFMEGKLKADYHYIAIKDDYSDLEEKLQYYIHNTGEALEIIKNAHAFVNQFKDPDREDLCALLVLKKYFELQKG